MDTLRPARLAAKAENSPPRPQRSRILIGSVVGGLGYLAYWLLSGGGDEPLAYLPPDCQVVGGMDGAAILASPLGAKIDEFLNSPMGSSAIGKYHSHGEVVDSIEPAFNAGPRCG